ncbi:hypothetical protein [Mucilaginibacter sp. HD30]
MKSIYQKIIIVLFILLFKILIWYVFEIQFVELSIYICENLGIVPKGKQDLFNGLPKAVTVFKVSFLIVDILLDLFIWMAMRFIFKEFTLKRFTYKYLIISFVLLVFILCFLN